VASPNKPVFLLGDAPHNKDASAQDNCSMASASLSVAVQLYNVYSPNVSSKLRSRSSEIRNGRFAMRRRNRVSKRKRPLEAAQRIPAQPVTFADARPASQPAPHLQSEPLLDGWPEGYECGGFRLDGADILIFAPGRPELRLQNAPPALAERQRA
jgi:hypothetical protein